jgi:diadenosine tetraphosphate (Ap4A) HIT family hydrolase
LVCPREHIKNYRSLSGPSGARLVRSLVNVGKEILGPEENAQFSFHIPPWNSIDHLHLHVIGQRKEMGWKAKLKYWEGTRYCKSAETAIRELDKNTPSESTTT